MFFHPQTLEKTTEGKARTARYKLADNFERNNYQAQYKELVVETYALYQRDISDPSSGRNYTKEIIKYSD